MMSSILEHSALNPVTLQEGISSVSISLVCHYSKLMITHFCLSSSWLQSI